MRKWFITLIMTAVLTVCANFAHADGSVNFGWDANSESDLAGYKLYYGSGTRDYQEVIDVGNELTFTVDNLTEGQTFYFALTAYDTSGNESGYSTEVVYEVPNVSPEIPEGFSIESVSVTFNWTKLTLTD